MKLDKINSTLLAIGGIALLTLTPAAAQQDVPFNMGIPVAPSGLVPDEIGDGPWVWPTGEDMDIRVTVLTKAIEFPWSLTFVDDNDILVATRGGEIRRVRNDRLEPTPVEGGPASYSAGISGLPGAVHGYMDLVTHPDFDDNRLLYLSYTKPVGDNRTALGIGRGRWTGSAIQGFEDIYVGEPGTGGPSRLVFGLDGTLYFSASGGNAQTLDNIGGKVLRINDDGSVPRDNPFVGQDGALPEIYTIGHRNTLGLAAHPTTGAIWQNENGPNGGDEINLLQPGGNYGWPHVSLGRTYTGPWQTPEAGPHHIDYIPPIVYWMPAIAVSGMTWYTGDALPKWKGDIFVGGLRYGEIFGTGQLQRILLNQNFEELRREVLLEDLHQRIRDVRQGPDGLLYVVTDEEAGAVLRIAPAN
ncbi:MAG: PQQ-dependent sugar dehydrogenase [Gammaproteobacteria bacterium]|nr:PQQ-dependent sugar dehydrogenase [Gammaproteobacteria bacterium]